VERAARRRSVAWRSRVGAGTWLREPAERRNRRRRGGRAGVTWNLPARRVAASTAAGPDAVRLGASSRPLPRDRAPGGRAGFTWNRQLDELPPRRPPVQMRSALAGGAVRCREIERLVWWEGCFTWNVAPDAPWQVVRDPPVGRSGSVRRQHVAWRGWRGRVRRPEPMTVPGRSCPGRGALPKVAPDRSTPRHRVRHGKHLGHARS
jgi:hypothetical protein